VVLSFIIIYLYPDLPKSAFVWILLIVFGPPVYLWTESIGDKYFVRFTEWLGLRRLKILNVVLFSILIVVLLLVISIAITETFK
jgi:hypothetical protein